MRAFWLSGPDDFEGWRDAAKAAFLGGRAPEDVIFRFDGQDDDLFSEQNRLPTKLKRDGNPPPMVPKAFIDLARQVICNTDPERFALLYRLLVRLQDDRTLLRQGADPDTHRANILAKEVRRDAHKMKAFVRFRKTGDADGIEQFVAWFEPSHHITRYIAPFFVKRFATMQWSILTPKGCIHWDTKEVGFSDPVPNSDAPPEDALEDYWKSYYASIFNPARLKIEAMTAEMPKKYWKNLPEAQLIPGLIQRAQERARAMQEAVPTAPKPGMMAHIAASAEKMSPDRGAVATLNDLKQALKGCRACPLWKPATQAVPGKGPADAGVMFVGEQPGDLEDLRGEPFVGPAGQVLREVVAEMGQSLERTYVTNAVKHFKFEPRGKNRLHKNPSAGEIDHCKWWVQKEIELVKPKVIVALGASAVRALTGGTQTIRSLRGAVHPMENGAMMVVTNHPSYILRLPDEAAKQQARAALSEDLERAFSLAAQPASSIESSSTS